MRLRTDARAARHRIRLLGALPMAASAQSTSFGPEEGDREFSISGTGSSDQSFDSGSFGVTGDLGWYLRNNVVAGIRQSVNYASIEGEDITDDFWNGTTLVTSTISSTSIVPGRSSAPARAASTATASRTAASVGWSWA